jgi:hypothetical protein
MITILIHPAADRQGPGMDAEVLFGHTHHPENKIKVRPLTINGIEYLTNGPLVIRRDRLHGVDRRWTRLARPVVHGLQFLADALDDTLTTAIPIQRFHVDVLCALQQCDAGIAVLSQTHAFNLHAVVHAGERVGLAVPIPDHLMASTLGAVPGYSTPQSPSRPRHDTPPLGLQLHAEPDVDTDGDRD